MNQRILGKTGRAVSEIGLGTWQLGTRWGDPFNRDGAAFDKGETFSGVPYDLGLEAAEELKRVFGTDRLAPVAIRWVLMHPEVSVVIPGASRAAQVLDNVQAAGLPPLAEAQMRSVRQVYDRFLRDIIHPQW